jgi:predicted CxxxxCH...CXXCH cytochrome family protein
MKHRAQSLLSTRMELALLVGVTASLGCNDRYVLIAGSSCGVPEDCALYASCTRRVEGCICRQGRCYFDRQAPERDPAQDPEAGCRSCHGSLLNSAPPLAVNGSADPVAIGVGAHQTHLRGGQGSRPMSCDECHIVPSDTASASHLDGNGIAEVTWGALSRTGGAQPTWDRATATCSNTYCHGATLHDGYLTAPLWTVVDGTQDACGTCHGLPPAAPHPPDRSCELCHLPTAGPALSIASPATHVDGVVQVQTDCVSCHGQGASAAPPLDLQGHSETTRVGVGAHQTHRLGGRVSKPVACTECHLVPDSLSSAGHVDTPPPAEVTFGPMASAGHSPVFIEPRCADTYCHNGSGGTVTQPIWNTVDGAQAACGACHGTPPAGPAHQSSAACANCHLPTAGDGFTIAERQTHVDGILQVSDADCGSCHGSAGNPAPPADLNGDTDPTDPEVGAHQAHVKGGTVSAPVACTACHLVPHNLNDPGHVDTPLPAEVTFSGRAVAQGAVPVWDPVSRTCTDTYCHGAASSLGTDLEPTWNLPGSIACGSCHGLPPAPPHPQADRCELCHAPTAGPGHTIADRSRHVDGVVDVDDRVPCASCHGSATNAAPPKDLGGSDASAKVGAHQAHLLGTGRSRPVPCAECHTPVDPATPNQAGHYDSTPPAEVTFGSLARSFGLAATWSGTSCMNTYCHGATLTGGTDITPDWSGGPRGCDDCHGMPPNDANHGNGTATQCQSCHPDVAGPGQTIINANRHVDGMVDLAAGCDVCHGSAGDPTPPVDTSGKTSSDAVGVHQAHRAPQNSAPVPCTSCHKVPATYGDAGHADTPLPAEVVFGGWAVAAGATPSWAHAQLRCTGTYCHGATLAGGAASVTWNDYSGAERACGACHGMPPATPGHAGVSGPNTCNQCHQDSAGPSQTITNKALHVDGIVEVSGGGCTSCHASPPTPADEDYANGGGAHTKHLAAGIECTICHGNNGSGATHNEGGGTVLRANVDVVFSNSVSFPGGTSMRNGQASATWTQSTQTCKVGCHNPVVGNPAEAPNLNRTVSWSGPAPGCVGCHDTVATTLPNNHPVSTLGDAGCLECHSPTGHMSGVLAFRDPDPSDAFAYAAGNIDGLCQTCHDAATVAFGGKTAQDASPYWTISAHGTAGIKCSRCHVYHSSTGGSPMSDRRSAACTASGCHDALLATFAQVAGGPVSHHRIEGGTGISLNCNDCHNAHLAQKSPLAAINPDNRWQAYSMPANAGSKRKSSGNYTTFCLACHDGAPPAGVTGAMNISAALSGGTDPSSFKIGSSSQHRSNHSGYNCQSCHDWHGSPGTKGAYNRGRMVLNYMGVSQFPYSRASSCSTGGGPIGCH